ncbi:MAG: hypothetical protein RL141_432 [Candidatus Parcubacteria bacterium]|jgi:hypothetical protein
MTENDQNRGGSDIPAVLNPQYADSYLTEHQHAQATNQCPYCEDQISRPEVIIFQQQGWFVKVPPAPWKTFWPKDDPNTPPVQIPARTHLLLIPERHIVFLHELTPKDWATIGELLLWSQEEFKIKGAILFMRYDRGKENLGYSGKTVAHAHAHVVEPPPFPEDMPNPGNSKALPLPGWAG